MWRSVLDDPHRHPALGSQTDEAPGRIKSKFRRPLNSRQYPRGYDRITWTATLASPRHAGRRPGIHDWQCRSGQRRGYRAFARHDGIVHRTSVPQLKQLFPLESYGRYLLVAEAVCDEFCVRSKAPRILKPDRPVMLKHFEILTWFTHYVEPT
jgi:hypothetical protein